MHKFTKTEREFLEEIFGPKCPHCGLLVGAPVIKKASLSTSKVKAKKVKKVK
jgi:hypothetical protein